MTFSRVARAAVTIRARRCIGREKNNPPPCWIFADRAIDRQRTLTVEPPASVSSQAAGVALAAKPSLAAYGDSANIWGSTTNASGEFTTRPLSSVNGDQSRDLGRGSRDSDRIDVIRVDESPPKTKRANLPRIRDSRSHFRAKRRTADSPRARVALSRRSCYGVLTPSPPNSLLCRFHPLLWRRLCLPPPLQVQPHH